LARRMHAELEALFVEDAEQLGVADLPVTHEIDLAGGGIRALDSGRLARAMRAEAEHLRHELAALDSGGESTWRVRVVRGRYGMAAADAAAGCDVAFLYRASRIAPERVRRPVWVLFDGAPAAERALAVAGDIATELGAALVALIPAADAAEAARLVERARALAGQLGERTLFRIVPPGRAAELAGTAVAGGAHLLVLARGAAASEPAAEARWLAALEIPVVLVA
ncbi:MAG: hypothetical protein R3286_20935, partial [Gammaproteobacteria bacterium]|nr:hypothetical protein [Gammaproteobacteria bacterium]